MQATYSGCVSNLYFFNLLSMLTEHLFLMVVGWDEGVLGMQLGEVARLTVSTSFNFCLFSGFCWACPWAYTKVLNQYA